MTGTLRIALLAVLCSAARACQQAGDDAATASPAAAGDTQPASGTTAGGDGSAAAGNAATITMRYACEPDTQVTVFSDDSARVALPDGQDVTMRRIAGSEPPTFTGGSLYFAIGETAAHLSQGDETNELACSPA